MRLSPLLLLGATVTTSALAPLRAQTPAYHHLPTAPSADSRLVWDSVRGRTVALERNPEPRIWYWDGSDWTLQLGAPSLAVHGDALFDPFRDRVIVPGANSILEWDGARWTGVTTSGGLARSAFDLNRRRIVSTDGAQVAEWDGSAWQTRTPAAGPGARSGFAFAYDPTNHRCLLYGGYDATNVFGDCWSWDGAAWTQLAASAPPGPRYQATLAYEHATGRMILFGGETGAATTWALSGAGWSQVPTTNDPGERYDAQLMWDGTGLLLHGGSVLRGGELWRFANDDWQELDGGVPMRRHRAAVGWDPVRSELVLFAGKELSTYPRPYFNDTWTFDGRWHHRQPSASPARLTFYQDGLVWSSAENRLLLFEGPGWTWNWTGSDWQNRAPVNSPSLRTAFAIATDPAGGVMLFGGMIQTGTAWTWLGDHWHWNGADWQQLAPAVSPSPRALPLAALDSVRSVVVLVGGSFMETWEWDGASWAQRAPTPFLIGSFLDRIAFRPETGRILVDTYDDYEWDGAAWTTLATATNYLYEASLVTATTRGQLLAYPQGASSSLNVGDLGVLTTTPATVARYGNGCALGPPPALSARGRPEPGQQGFRIAVATCAPNAPTFVALGLGATNQPLGSGCSLLVGNVLGVVAMVAAPTGEVELPLPLPPSPALRGVAFCAQAAVLDPARGLYGPFTISDGLRVTIGD